MLKVGANTQEQVEAILTSSDFYGQSKFGNLPDEGSNLRGNSARHFENRLTKFAAAASVRTLSETPDFSVPNRQPNLAEGLFYEPTVRIASQSEGGPTSARPAETRA